MHYCVIPFLSRGQNICHTFIYNLKKATVSEVAIYCPLAPSSRDCDEGDNHGSRRACESKALHLRTNQPEGKRGGREWGRRKRMVGMRRGRVLECEEKGGEEREGMQDWSACWVSTWLLPETYFNHTYSSTNSDKFTV